MTSIDVTDGSVASMRGAATPWRAAWLLAAVAGLLVAFWPLGTAGDYMNHLARNYIEAHIWSDPILQRYYTVSAEIIPDLAMDMIVPWLSYVTGIYAAGALATGIAIVLPPLAGLVVARSLHGKITWIALLGFLAMFNQNIQWGFVNYNLSTGLALVGFAFWIRGNATWRRATAFAVFGGFLALCHALGFLLFGYLVLLWEIGSQAKGPVSEARTPLRAFLRRLMTMDAVAMLPGLLVVLLATGGSEQLPQAGAIRFAVGQKVDSLWSGAAFFNPSLAMLVTVVLTGVFWLGLRRGILRMDPRMVWVCSGLLILIVAIPTTVFGIWGLHFRYQAALIILAAASVTVQPGSRRLAIGVAAIAAALMTAICVNGGFHMARIDGMARANRDLLRDIPRGARILSAHAEDTNPLVTFHAAAIGVIERSAYVPNLFTNTSPVGVTPEMRAFHMPQAWPLLAGELAASVSLEPPGPENGFWSPDYFFGWPRHWDYVIYFRSRPDEALELPYLCETGAAPNAVLYRISGEGCGSDAPRAR